MLTDNAGNPLTGLQDITVSLYTVSTGGSPYWHDTCTINLTNGRFSVVLGSDANPLSSQLSQFNGQTYVGVQVGSDPEMTPRQKMRSVPYALVAGSVNNTASIIPPGTVVAYAGTTAPAGSLMCDGSAVSRITYAALCTAIGYLMEQEMAQQLLISPTIEDVSSGVLTAQRVMSLRQIRRHAQR